MTFSWTDQPTPAPSQEGSRSSGPPSIEGRQDPFPSLEGLGVGKGLSGAGTMKENGKECMIH